MMREKDRREKEAAEMKQKEKEEREQKRLEKEQETLTEVRTRVATRVLHTIRAPDRYQDESDADSEASNTVCIICYAREPPISASTVFGLTATVAESGHTHCALGDNTASRQFVGSSCCA